MWTETKRVVFSDLGEASAVCGLRGTCACALDGSELRADDGRTVSIEKIVSLYPRVKNLNLKKVIKVSYLNRESRQCFVFFGFLCVWTFYEHYEHSIDLNILAVCYAVKNFWRSKNYWKNRIFLLYCVQLDFLPVNYPTIFRCIICLVKGENSSSWLRLVSQNQCWLILLGLFSDLYIEFHFGSFIVLFFIFIFFFLVLFSLDGNCNQ